MSLKRFQSGFFDEAKENPAGEVPPYLDRRALLVYSGNFESMDGLVEVKDEHIDRLANNHNSLISRVGRLASGEIPLKFCPPVQLDHSLSAKDTVGRLVGLLEAGDHEVEPGKKVKALYGVLRVLGKENVEKVMDQRWTNLSIGADLETGKFSELTITPFPAAADAAMLSRMGSKTETYNGKKMKITKGEGMDWYLEVGDIKRGPFQKEEDAILEGRQIVDSGVLNKFSKGDEMLKRLKAFVMRTMKLSEADADKKMAEMPEEEKSKLAEDEKKDHERMKKHLTEVKKMTEEDADKHLSDMNMDEVKKLMDEVSEHEKKMAAQPYEGKETPEEEALEPTHKMAKAREALTKLSTDFRKASETAKLAAKKAELNVRLSQLRSDAKITPAEVKKIDLAKLSKASDETVEAVFKSYEGREPVIITGLFGSKTEANMADVAKSVRMSKLESEVRKNMPLLSRVKMQEQEEVKAQEKTEPDAALMNGDMETELSEIEKMLDEGKIHEVKARIRTWSGKYMSPAGQHQGSTQAEMSALAESVKHMHNEFDKAIQLMSSIVGSEQTEKGGK